jgi:hypothetical protein
LWPAVFSGFLATAEEAAASKAQVSRKELLISQLARMHPVAFFQFLDLCARSGQLTGSSTGILADLAAVGSATVGIKGWQICSAARQRQQHWAQRCAA